MTTHVKICGLRTDEALGAALDGGADSVGFVFFPPSPRNIAPADARPLAARARGRARVVALLVDPDDALIDQVVTIVDPDMLQLHGEETPARVGAIRKRWGKSVMKAVKIETGADARKALDYRAVADLILFDARPPAGATRPGGHGAAFDWHVLDDIKTELPRFMLSGGLTPGNVAEAIGITGAPMVDVSSGVERRPGEKDPDLIRAFLRAAKAL